MHQSRHGERYKGQIITIVVNLTEILIYLRGYKRLRSKKILLNSSIGLIREAVNMICGFYFHG